MSPVLGTVIVLAARSTDCPTASVYGPVTTAADTKVTEGVAVFGTVMAFASKATAPCIARSRPPNTVPEVFIVMEVYAKMVPLKTELPPIVAELPTCQKTLPAWAPPLRITWRPTKVTNVDAVWKMKTAFGSPPASSVRSPDEISSEDEDL